MALIIKCIDTIYDANNLYPAKDLTKEEIRTWMENLNQEHFQKIRDFFDTMPKLRYTTELECPICVEKHTVVVEGLQSFFG